MLETTPTRSERRSSRKRRKRVVVILVSALLVLVGVAVAVGGFYTYATGASGPQENLVFTIPEGATGGEVAGLLQEAGVIRSALAFRLVARIEGSELRFAAGDYDLKTNMSAQAVLDVLERGPLAERGVMATFPEGYRIEQVATRASDELGVDREEFVTSATDGKYPVPGFLPEGRGVEGFLLPNTYEFDRDVTAEGVVRRLIDEFQDQTADLPWDRAEGLGLTRYEVVTVASMIEREARFQEDRAKIAAVIYNRLEMGIRLEIDATVQYALGSWGPIQVQDRQIDHAYNTYRIDGLPPGPICSPGLTSLEAALQPADANYLYYVVIDAEGHHAFTDSYEEFLQLVDRYQG